MNCLDCAAVGRRSTAVAVCSDCGAAVCYDHAHVAARWLTRTTAINRTVQVEPPARTIRCALCQAANDHGCVSSSVAGLTVPHTPMWQ
jgi:hypothetical protein